MENIYSIVRDAESNYIDGITTISKYVDFGMYEVINTIDAYLNSVHISGSEDALGRTKPFFNIVTAARNIWYRSTDIDRKDIVIKVPQSGSNQVILTLAANILFRQWIKKANFGKVLNDWGRALASYGSGVLKFVEKDGELTVSVISWNRLIPDVIDFENNIKIEVLEFTPAQLRKQEGYDQEIVENLLSIRSAREGNDNRKRDNKDEYIKVYEVHGELPLSLLTGKEKDEKTYVQQMHVVSFVKGEYNRNTRSYDYDNFCLYQGKEKQDPYFKTDLISEDGRTLGKGAVENLFEAQWMVNHSVKLEKDVLDIASLVIMMTADKDLVGKNVLSSLISGDLLVHADGKPIVPVNNQHDITQIVNFGVMWQRVAQEITSTPDALRGDYAPSGTAWRQVEALRIESHSLFEQMKENKGLAIEEMMRKFIIPYLKTQMDTTDEITDILSDAEIAQFDSIYIPQEAIKQNNKQIIDTVLSGQIADNNDLEVLQGNIKNELAVYGNQRFLKPSEISSKTWKEVLKDFEWKAECNPTEESIDTRAALETLNTMLQTAVNNPELYRFLVNKILENTGQVSPVEIPNFKPQIQQISPMAAIGQNVKNNNATSFQ